MVLKIALICILAFLIFNFSSSIATYESAFLCMGCNSEYGWPWVYRIAFDGDTRVMEGDPTGVFYLSAFIADTIVAILISAFIIYLSSFIINKFRKENS